MSQFKNRITDMLGIKYPIIQGALAMIGRAKLAAAVSEAGGLGMITAWTLRTPEKLRGEIHKMRTLTDKPFAVDRIHRGGTHGQGVDRWYHKWC